MKTSLPKNDSQDQKLVVPDATPRPWIVWCNENYENKAFSICYAPGGTGYDANHKCIAETRGDYKGANARLIVRAVNSLDALVAAVESLRAYVLKLDEMNALPYAEQAMAAMSISHAALKLAKGE